MMTEAEAKTKWCPFVRYLATFRNPTTDRLETAGCYNRGAEDSGLQMARCIGSACMAWRVEPYEWDGIPANHPGPRPNPPHGYCGLAGAPAS